MRFSARLQVLICLMAFASSAEAIMVKFGTKDGPIEPPTPEPSIAPPQPYRVPAPVWEERSNDTPDPNAHWRPPLFVPQSRYTKVGYNPTTLKPLPLNSAQRFVNAYAQRHEPVIAEDLGAPLILSSQTLPGVGLRYFFPALEQEKQKQHNKKQNDAKLNHIDADLGAAHDADSDLQWKQEKESTRRNTRNNQEATARAPGRPVYLFPLYVQPRHR